MNEATDVVVSTPTGRYQTKTDSVARTKQKEKMGFRSSADRNRVTVKRATPRDKRFTDREPVQEKAVSKQQQKFFGLVRAIQKGEASGSPEAEKAAQDMSKKDVKDFASTKHKGLPKKVQSESDLVKRIKCLRKKSMNEDNDLKKVAKELKNASKMHMAQSKRVEKHLSKMKEEYDFDANTLLQQLGGGKFIAMTGAKNLMVDQKEKSLHMRIGKNSKGINHVKITLMPDDTYKMDFGRIRKLDYKVVRSVTGVYAEALRDVFTEVTGCLLYTSDAADE